MLVYSFKVSLLFDKRIYRNIEIPEHQTLADLHNVIFDAFDRNEKHLYSYFLTRKATKSIRTIYNSLEYAHPMAIEDYELFGFKRRHNAEKTKIGKLGLKEKEKLYYLFDFGDEWWHELTVSKILEAENPKEYPKIARKVGKSPEQYPYYPDYDDYDDI